MNHRKASLYVKCNRLDRTGRKKFNHDRPKFDYNGSLKYYIYFKMNIIYDKLTKIYAFYIFI